jgi:hypothetical protein
LRLDPHQGVSGTSGAVQVENMGDLYCVNGRDVAVSGLGQNRSECNVRDFEATSANNGSYEYSWSASGQVFIQFGEGGMVFEFQENDVGFTERQVGRLIDHFKALMRLEHERSIRGNQFIGWITRLRSGPPPNRNHQFRAMTRAVTRAENAASAERSLTNVQSALMDGFGHMNRARQAWSRYANIHIRTAETNEMIVRATRDVSLTVSSGVLTGGVSSVVVSAGVAVGTSALTDGWEEIALASIGENTDIDWGEIFWDLAMSAILDIVGGGFNKRYGDRIKDSIGAFARNTGMTRVINEAFMRKFAITAAQSDQILATMGGQMRGGGGSSTALVSQLGIDGPGFVRIVWNAFRKAIEELPVTVLKTAVQGLFEEMRSARTRSDSLEGFWQYFVDGLTSPLQAIPQDNPNRSQRAGQASAISQLTTRFLESLVVELGS